MKNTSTKIHGFRLKIIVHHSEMMFGIIRIGAHIPEGVEKDPFESENIVNDESSGQELCNLLAGDRETERICDLPIRVTEFGGDFGFVLIAVFFENRIDFLHGIKQELRSALRIAGQSGIVLRISSVGVQIENVDISIVA